MLMKKWWLECPISDRITFRGWMNTIHSSKDDIPDKIKGRFWCSRENCELYGQYKLDSEYDKYSDGNCFVFGNGNYISPQLDEMIGFDSFERDRVNSELEWDRVEMRIEDCINESLTYVMDYGRSNTLDDMLKD